jgi:hypothetical protein
MTGNLTPLARGDFRSIEESLLLRKLTSQERHPNLLVVCRDADAMVRHLAAWCAAPHSCLELPGPLRLPDRRCGTLFLKRAEGLTKAQQIVLYDWLSAGCEGLQIATVATVPLQQLVEDGRFLEGLYYRLNVVRLESGDTTQ